MFLLGPSRRSLRLSTKSSKTLNFVGLSLLQTSCYISLLQITGILNPNCTQSLMAANNSGLPAGVDKETAFTLAQSEMEYRVELFNRLAQTCFNKCVDRRYKENELNMGENSCIDRCVSKYWAVNNIVGQMISGGQRPM